MGQVHTALAANGIDALPSDLNELGVVPICIAPGETPFAHSHDCVEEVLIVKSGTGQFELERECHEVCAGSVAVVEAGEFHALTNTGTENLEALVVYNANVDLEGLVLKTREEHFGTGVGAEERAALAELRQATGALTELLGELQGELAALRSAPKRRRAAAKS